ncbi:MAG TPA: CDP-glucose 4,6-dehydratase [Myxococcales bacterium]|jgi:CDP-glucose 4,6-dehydratase
MADSPDQVQTLREAFRGRRVLLTGHTGFKGSWLALWLDRLGARVWGYALPPPTKPSNFELSGVVGLLQAHREADVRDAGTLAAAFAEADPEVVFHLAAQPLVRESYRTPAETFEVNVMGTARVLDAVRLRGKPCAVVVITTDKCYENREQVWGYRECDPMGGHDPYSASKGAAEILVASYRRSFFSPERLSQHGVAVASARAGNVIGGGDWSIDRVVTDSVRCLIEKAPVPVRNPRAVRPWQHVLEPLSGYLLLAARMLAEPSQRWCSGWNLGPRLGDELPVSELVDRFCKAWGDGAWEDVSDPHQPHEAGILRLSIEKARVELGWEPRWSVGEAVDRTARWYREALTRGADARQLCMEDIAAYEAAMSLPRN